MDEIVKREPTLTPSPSPTPLRKLSPVSISCFSPLPAIPPPPLEYATPSSSPHSKPTSASRLSNTSVHTPPSSGSRPSNTQSPNDTVKYNTNTFTPSFVDSQPPAQKQRRSGGVRKANVTPQTPTRFAPRTESGDRQCTNCGETDTPQWRGTLCNACALWKRSRGSDRPLPLTLPPRKRSRSLSVSDDEDDEGELVNIQFPKNVAGVANAELVGAIVPSMINRAHANQVKGERADIPYVNAQSKANPAQRRRAVGTVNKRCEMCDATKGIGVTAGLWLCSDCADGFRIRRAETEDVVPRIQALLRPKGHRPIKPLATTMSEPSFPLLPFRSSEPVAQNSHRPSYLSQQSPSFSLTSHSSPPLQHSGSASPPPTTPRHHSEGYSNQVYHGGSTTRRPPRPLIVTQPERNTFSSNFLTPQRHTSVVAVPAPSITTSPVSQRLQTHANQVQGGQRLIQDGSPITQTPSSISVSSDTPAQLFRTHSNSSAGYHSEYGLNTRMHIQPSRNVEGSPSGGAGESNVFKESNAAGYFRPGKVLSTQMLRDRPIAVLKDELKRGMSRDDFLQIAGWLWDSAANSTDVLEL